RRAVNASRMPLARSRRQVVSNEKYKPSRRRRAPTAPRVAAAASASSRMRCLYSVLSVRRLALATTSGSGRESAPALAAAALHCGSPGGEPSLRSAPAKPPGERTTPREFPFISDLFFLALLLIN